MEVEIKASEYDALVDLGSTEMTTSAVSRIPENAGIAKHIVSIKKKIEASIVDKSWVKTRKDNMRLLKDRSSQFKCNNLILKDPTVPNPDIGNGLIKVEPYDFSDDGIIVVVPRGDMRKKIEVQGRGIVEANVFSEIRFRDILEFQEHGSTNWPQPTLFCNFRNGSPFCRDVYYDVATMIQLDESKILSLKTVSNE